MNGSALTFDDPWAWRPRAGAPLRPSLDSARQGGASRADSPVETLADAAADADDVSVTSDDEREAGADLASAEEHRLVVRVQQGDTEAFDALVRRYVRRAHAIARRLMQNPADAEDLVQDAFLRALERIGTFDARRAFGPWFFRLLVNTGLDTHRKSKVRRTEPENLETPSKGPSPLQSVEREEIRRRFEEALAVLPPRQRFIVWAYEVDGLSTEEIADELGVSQGTVRSHLHHGRHALRAALGVVKD
jgi:RNA polymerase sigma-70 factor (ECF subfamily)